MAFTQKDLDTLERAIALGATTVQYEDRRITYKSTGELLRVRSLMRRALGIDERGPVQRGSWFSKGLYPSGGYRRGDCRDDYTA